MTLLPPPKHDTGGSAEHIHEGLRRFARGDVQGAKEAWQAVESDEPTNTRVRALLYSMEQLLPKPRSAHVGRTNEPWGGPSQTAPVEMRSDGPGLGLFGAPPVIPTQAGPASAKNVLTLQARLHDLLVLHDFSGALDIAEQLLRIAPGYAPALRARYMCRDTLQHMYESRLGSIKLVPRVLIGAEEIPWLNLDPRAGFVLSQVDGVSSYEEIRDVSGLDMLEALRVLTKLVNDQVIGAKPDVSL